MDPALRAAGLAVAGLPRPGPLAAEGWGGRAWFGASLYLLLFAAALWGVWVLVRGTPGGGKAE